MKGTLIGKVLKEYYKNKLVTTNLYPGICPVFLLGLQLDIEWQKCQLSQKLLSIYFSLFNYILLYTYLMVLWSVFISAIYFNKIILKQENFQKSQKLSKLQSLWLFDPASAS